MEADTNNDLELALQLCHEISGAVNAYLTTLDLRNKDLYGMLLGSKALRANSFFVGACELAERKLASPARVLIRTLLELRFVAEALVRNPAWISDLIAADEQMRKRAFKNLRAVPAEQRARNVSDEQLQAAYDSIDAGQKTVTVAQWAERADRLQEYKLVYMLLSTEVHPSLRAAEAHLVMDEAGNVCELDGQPEVDGLPHKLLYAADCLIAILLCIPEEMANSGARQRLTTFCQDRRWIEISQRALEAVELQRQQQQ